MRFSTAATVFILTGASSSPAACAFQTSLRRSNAIVSRPNVSFLNRNEKKLILMSASSTENSSASFSSKRQEEVNQELASGKVLNSRSSSDNSIRVVDFGSIKNQNSRAEIALEEAKKIHSTSKSSSEISSIDNRLMGINDDVVKEVGHEIGSFVTEENSLIMQRCASFLRANAPSGMFEPLEQSIDNTFEQTDIPEYNSMLTKSYIESGEVTEAFAKTFYLGTKLMPLDAREAIWAIYVWCRRTDEIVDAPRDLGSEELDNEAMLSDLSQWELRLERLWKYGEIVDVLDLPLLDVRIKYPNLPIAPFTDMVRGMLMDIKGLGQEQYDTFEELHLYCYRVAGTVGLMSMPIFGCAPGYTEVVAKEPALSLGVAFQITNILRDVGEDANNRGRIYLPRDDMARFGVTDEQIYNKKLDQNYINLMKYQIARARQYYDKALSGVPMLSEESRLPVQSSLDCYGMILDKIEENGYDNLTKRAYASKWEKLSAIPFSWYRTQDLAKFLPLPGDGRTFASMEDVEKQAGLR